MDDATAGTIADGWRALEACDWGTARDLFAPLVDGGDPAVLDGYGFAIWFLGDPEAGIELRQRAAVAYGARGDCDQAAKVAVWVSHQHMVGGRTSLANGWLARAERALEDHADCSGAGWVAVEKARRSSGDDGIATIEHALALGRSCGDDDLEVFALSILGAAHVAAGRLDEGMTRLEEAMAAASAGRIRDPHTLGAAYCQIIMACTTAGDWERASEWCHHVHSYASRHDYVPLFGACRTVHAEVLVATGRWQDAEASLADALTPSTQVYSGIGESAATLAQLRVLQGRLTEAGRLLAKRDEHPLALLALAQLRTAEGQPQVAAALLERGIAGSDDTPLMAARLLAPLVEAHLATGAIDDARAAATRLAALATATGGDLLHGRAELAAARVGNHDGDHTAAHEHARRALDAFGHLAMTYEAALARVELARATATERHDLAVEEARAALAVFRDLGAARDHDATAALLRELGAGTAAGVRGDGDLTLRERQVLDLLAQGMSNAQIGAALYISEKTAGHHVSRILAKLGVANRAEAAAQASRLAAPAAQ